MLLPSAASVGAVGAWLDSHNISDVVVDADWISFSTTVGRANLLLGTQFQWFRPAASDINGDGSARRRLRTLHYSVPDSLAGHVNLVHPTTRFGRVRSNIVRSKRLDQGYFRAAGGGGATDAAADAAAAAAGDCSFAVTPACLKTLYSIGDYAASNASGSRIGFCSYLDEYARYSDLQLFEQSFAPSARGQSFSVVPFNGGQNDQSSGSDSTEANLDVQFIVGVSAPLPVTEFSTAGLGPLVPDLSEPSLAEDTNEPYLEFLHGVLRLNQSDLPQVISTSYGEDEQVGGTIVHAARQTCAANGCRASRPSSPSRCATSLPSSAAAACLWSSRRATRASARAAWPTTAQTAPSSCPSSPPAVRG